MQVKKRWIGWLAALVLMTAWLAPSGQTAVAGTVEIDALLAQTLRSASATTPVTAILTFDHVPTTTDIAAVSATGLKIHRFARLPMLAVRGLPAQVQAALGLGGLVSAYADKPLQYLLRESVPLIGADRVWNELGYTGKGVGVAVIDSGIDATHPDLQYGSVVVQNVKILAPNFFGPDPVIAENLPTSDTSSGHGTHVAGTVAGRGAASDGTFKGVAPDASLIGIGAGDAISILFALQGFDYALEHQTQYNIRVISNSWGTTGPFAAGDPVNVASKRAHDAGIAVVFASGNEGPGENTLNPYSVAPWVIGVAAGNKDGQTIADFSSRGIPGDALYHPTITAPGVDIVSTRAPNTVLPPLAITDDASLNPAWLPYYTTMSGTSMATPHISGVLALMLEAKPSLTPDLLKDLLIVTARPMPGYAEFEVGAGYVDAYAAVSQASTTTLRPGQTKGKDGKTYRTLIQTYSYDGLVGPGTPAAPSSDVEAIAVGSNAIKLTSKIAWSNPVVDLDLYVFDPAGAQEGSSGQALTSAEETTVTTLDGSPLAVGTHSVEARGYLSVAESYQGTITIEYIVGRAK